MINLTPEADRIIAIVELIKELQQVIDKGPYSEFFPKFSPLFHIIQSLFGLMELKDLELLKGVLTRQQLIDCLGVLEDNQSLKFINYLTLSERRRHFIDLVSRNQIEICQILWEQQRWLPEWFDDHLLMLKMIKYYHLYKMVYWLHSIGFQFDSLCYEYAEHHSIHPKVRSLMEQVRENKNDI